MDYNTGGGDGGSSWNSNNNSNSAYMSSPQANSSNNNNSQTSPDQNRRKATEEQTLIPVTARMILTSQEKILSDGREPHLIKLVAAVRSAVPQSTSYQYEVEDGTGLVEIKEWVDQNDSQVVAQMREEASQENIYVRIIGKLQVYEGKTTVIANSVRKVKSGNELTHHLLEVVHSSEKYRKDNQIVGAPDMAMSTNMNMGGMTNNGQSNGGFTGGGGGFGNGGAPIESSMGGNNADELTSAIKKYIFEKSQENPELGASISNFIAQHQGQYQEGQIRMRMKQLERDGEIYSTSDEDHYSTV